MDFNMTFDMAFPKAVYKPTNIPVEIREVSFQRDGTVKSYLVFTQDGSLAFQWRGYKGGEGIVTIPCRWAWVPMSDLGILGLCQHPEQYRVVVHTTVDSPTGFDGEVIYSEEHDAFERCTLCGEITQEHVLTHEEE